MTFLLPAEAGLDPDIARVHVDRATRSVELDYAAPSGTGTPSTAEHILVFVELAPSDLPRVPFTIVDAAGATVVPTLPAVP